MQMNGIGPNSRFIENNLMGPKISLCYDKEEKRIFWSDQGTGRIESAEITGFNLLIFINFWQNLCGLSLQIKIFNYE